MFQDACLQLVSESPELRPPETEHGNGIDAY